MPKILVVEDDSSTRELVKDALLAERYTVDTASTGNDALLSLKSQVYELVILDWNLPDMSGLEILKQFRSYRGTAPVLMLTGRQEIECKEQGLDAGADDYLTKPFLVRELLARVRAILRRPPELASSSITIKHVTIDLESFRVTRDGQEVKLLPKEFALLQFLMQHTGKVFSSEALIQRVWDSDSDASPDTIRIYVNRLRNKLDIKGEASLIGTVHGVGYRLDP